MTPSTSALFPQTLFCTSRNNVPLAPQIGICSAPLASKTKEFEPLWLCVITAWTGSAPLGHCVNPSWLMWHCVSLICPLFCFCAGLDRWCSYCVTFTWLRVLTQALREPLRYLFCTASLLLRLWLWKNVVSWDNCFFATNSLDFLAGVFNLLWSTMLWHHVRIYDSTLKKSYCNHWFIISYLFFTFNKLFKYLNIDEKHHCSVHIHTNHELK